MQVEMTQADRAKLAGELRDFIADSIYQAADQIEADGRRIAELEAAMREAITWDSHDEEGVPAVWLDRFRAALGDTQ